MYGSNFKIGTKHTKCNGDSVKLTKSRIKMMATTDVTKDDQFMNMSPKFFYQQDIRINQDSLILQKKNFIKLFF